jgi:hypothetical protein
LKFPLNGLGMENVLLRVSERYVVGFVESSNSIGSTAVDVATIVLAE